MYVPYTSPGWGMWSRSMYLAVRTTSEPLSLAPALRQQINTLDADLPLAKLVWSRRWR